MPRKVALVVYCEDRQHWAFIRRFLEITRPGAYREIRPKISPKGRGAAENWVLKQYADALRNYRNKSRPKHQVMLMRDVDASSFGERLSQFDRASDEASIKKRQPGERVAIFLPARNIETWFAYLNGETVEETRTRTYRKLDQESDCAPCVEQLARMCGEGKLRRGAPPSLEKACDEYNARVKGKVPATAGSARR
jgi:hypothetical protein